METYGKRQGKSPLFPIPQLLQQAAAECNLIFGQDILNKLKIFTNKC